MRFVSKYLEAVGGEEAILAVTVSSAAGFILALGIVPVDAFARPLLSFRIVIGPISLQSGTIRKYGKISWHTDIMTAVPAGLSSEDQICLSCKAHKYCGLKQ